MLLSSQHLSMCSVPRISHVVFWLYLLACTLHVCGDASFYSRASSLSLTPQCTLDGASYTLDRVTDDVNASYLVGSSWNIASTSSILSYERCRATHRCPRAYANYDALMDSISFSRSMYRGGIREHALVWLDFEDLRMGTLGVEAAQVPRIGKSIVGGSSSFAGIGIGIGVGSGNGSGGVSSALLSRGGLGSSAVNLGGTMRPLPCAIFGDLVDHASLPSWSGYNNSG